MPLTDAYVTEDRRAEPEPRYPLTVVFCTDCSLVQLKETVAPEAMFVDYQHYSSVMETLLRHSRANALDLIESRSLGPSSLVVELASNDGYLLKNFVEAGIPVLGIDPAEGPSAAAIAAGVPTLTEFFDAELAEKLVAEGMAADVVIANNVLAHVPDTNGFVAGITALLKDDGVAVIEVPYVREMVERCEFDTVYHEHLCYFSASALVGLFRRHGLYLNDVVRLDIYGGSLRLYVGKFDDASDRVTELLTTEATDGVVEESFYRDFAGEVRECLDGLKTTLADLQASGYRIAGYGAAAKATILLNAAGLGRDDIDFIADRNVHKQGTYLPGTGIPIRPPEALLDERPDYVLLLAWSFKDEIVAQQQEFIARGGRFLVPVPGPEFIPG
jgi:SAM-dependent methyltransferase